MNPQAEVSVPASACHLVHAAYGPHAAQAFSSGYYLEAILPHQCTRQEILIKGEAWPLSTLNSFSFVIWPGPVLLSEAMTSPS